MSFLMSSEELNDMLQMVRRLKIRVTHVEQHLQDASCVIYNLEKNWKIRTGSCRIWLAFSKMQEKSVYFH